MIMGTIDRLILKWFDDNLNVMTIGRNDNLSETEIGGCVVINPIENRIQIPRQEISMVKTMFSLSFDEFCEYLMKWLGKRTIKIQGFNYLFILG